MSGWRDYWSDWSLDTEKNQTGNNKHVPSFQEYSGATLQPTRLCFDVRNERRIISIPHTKRQWLPSAISLIKFPRIRKEVFPPPDTDVEGYETSTFKTRTVGTVQLRSLHHRPGLTRTSSDFAIPRGKMANVKSEHGKRYPGHFDVFSLFRS